MRYHTGAREEMKNEGGQRGGVRVDPQTRCNEYFTADTQQLLSQTSGDRQRDGWLDGWMDSCPNTIMDSCLGFHLHTNSILYC